MNQGASNFVGTIPREWGQLFMKNHGIRLLKQPYHRILFFALALKVLMSAQAGGLLYIQNTNYALDVLPPPPSPASQEEHADSVAAAWATNICTSEQKLHALEEQKEFSPFLCFTNEIGTFFQQRNLPKTAVFLQRVLGSTD